MLAVACELCVKPVKSPTTVSAPLCRSCATTFPSGALLPPGPHWQGCSSVDQMTLAPTNTGPELLAPESSTNAPLAMSRRHGWGKPLVSYESKTIKRPSGEIVGQK